MFEYLGPQISTKRAAAYNQIWPLNTTKPVPPDCAKLYKLWEARWASGQDASWKLLGTDGSLCQLGSLITLGARMWLEGRSPTLLDTATD